jgi:predicted amidohydrolase YtcJ
MNPLRTLLRRGTGVFFGSDGMPASPRFGIRCAMGHPVASERLTLEEAHRLYTEEAARAVAGDPAGARLAAGSPADVVVLPTAPEAVGDEVVLTVLGGRIVHRAFSLRDARADDSLPAPRPLVRTKREDTTG